MPRITIPLDASGIDDLDPEQPIKVLVSSGGKPLASQEVTLGGKGLAEVSFELEAPPRGLRIVVGPADADDEELLGLQTIGVDVPLRRWQEQDSLEIPPIRISAYYWFWWLRWCRRFTIRGRILCPDGSPVPGAVVCAYDVDAWWWWWSKQQVGCATTDASGAFSISFRWCCGWWPWWWWRLRRWYVEPRLARTIVEALQREPRFADVPLPDPQPDLRIFERLGRRSLLPGSASSTRPPGAMILAGAATRNASLRGAEALPARRPIAAVDPADLSGLREMLVAQLPAIPALETLRLWPWHPWLPWWDCSPDIVFRATQTCGGQERVIIDEGWFAARWNIGQTLDVTLTATEEACCIPRNDCLEGECLALAKVCGVDADEVGGNPGADATPAGYAFANVVSNGGDAPFGGVVSIRGTTQCLSGVDYYEIEYSADSGATWQVMPPPGLGSFVREYWDFVLGTDVNVPFSATVPIDGHHVYETLEHYEATHTPGDWGGSKVWLGTNIDMVFPWLSDTGFTDGLYGLRVVGYDESGGTLTNPRVLPVCDSDEEAQIIVFLDNQTTFAEPGPPDNPCGSGTNHTCTNEPMTDIIDARIVHAGGSETQIGPCGEITVGSGDMLEVDFVAYDAQGHLAWYDLIATFGENGSRDLLALGGTLTPLPGVPGVPAALQVGPDYVTARGPLQSAPAPVWAGGAIRLSVPAVGPSGAFPLSCCYQLELRAYKRTIVNCLANNAHRNLSERSFQVSV